MEYMFFMEDKMGVESNITECHEVNTRWELHDMMFSVDHMLRRVESYAIERNMIQTKIALKVMCRYHEGQYRNGKDKLPYIVHPLTLACHAFALGIGEDNLIAACLLHDVLEDTEATSEDLGVNKEVLKAVELVTFRVIEGLTKEESKELYYEKIGENKIASMVKLLDRCNNVSTMATGFKKNRIERYIDETEKYIFPILDIVKHSYLEYYDATFLLKYQMLSVIESLKRIL